MAAWLFKGLPMLPVHRACLRVLPATPLPTPCLHHLRRPQVYEKPINEAAKELEIGVTVLKKYCRKFDIQRWPYRKLKSVGGGLRTARRPPAGWSRRLGQRAVNRLPVPPPLLPLLGTHPAPSRPSSACMHA